jgi:hypothetical protein
VLVKEIPPDKSLPALLTLVGLHMRVGESVLLLVVLVFEDPIAEVAGEGGTNHMVRGLDAHKVVDFKIIRIFCVGFTIKPFVGKITIMFRENHKLLLQQIQYLTASLLRLNTVHVNCT